MTKIEKIKKKVAANAQEKNTLEGQLTQLKYDRQLLETAIDVDTQSGSGLDAFRAHKAELRELDDEINFVEIRLKQLDTEAMAKDCFDAWDEYIEDYKKVYSKRVAEIGKLQKDIMNVVNAIADSQCEALKVRAMLADIAGVKSTGIPIADEYPAFKLPFFDDSETIKYMNAKGLLSSDSEYYKDVFNNKISDAKRR